MSSSTIINCEESKYLGLIFNIIKSLRGLFPKNFVKSSPSSSENSIAASSLDIYSKVLSSFIRT